MEVMCTIGLLPVFLRFAGEEYPRELRVEAAYLIGQMCHGTELLLKLFLSGGGLEALPKLLDTNYIENNDLVMLSLDCMLTLAEDRGDDYLKVWAFCGVIERLILTIDNIIVSADNESYLLKACDLLLLFSTVIYTKAPRSV